MLDVAIIPGGAEVRPGTLGPHVQFSMRSLCEKLDENSGFLFRQVGVQGYIEQLYACVA